MLAAVAAASLTLLLGSGIPVRRFTAPIDPGGPAPGEALLTRLRIPLVVLAVVGGWLLLGGLVGFAAGVIAGVLGWRVLGRVESPAAVRRRAVLSRELPMAVHLLGAALAAGAAVPQALRAVAEAMPGPIREEFERCSHRLVLGADAGQVWRTLDGPLAPLGRTMARAEQSGSTVLGAVDGLAAELRSRSRGRVEALARSVEVRSAAPLGVCFLPAFILLGVVPLTVGIFASLRLFG